MVVSWCGWVVGGLLAVCMPSAIFYKPICGRPIISVLFVSSAINLFEILNEKKESLTWVRFQPNSPCVLVDPKEMTSYWSFTTFTNLSSIFVAFAK